MGGLTGLSLASLPKTPIQKLVLNDVGPAISVEGLLRIGAYLGQPLRWKTLDEAADYLWSISQSFGPHTREQWLELTRPMLKPDGEGGFKLHYDPAIAVPFAAITPQAAAIGEAALWQAYDAIRCPTLLLRGAQSDLLTPSTALAMTQRGPKARLVEFAGIGHVPTLIADDQLAVVREFLLSP
jgi:pimeloyl-ACP methyl ester carboxylesterase